MAPFADLNTTWFALIGLLWAGYLFLEGFDFGVSVVTPFVSKDEIDRRTCLNAIGPVWDGNEVWLLTAVPPLLPFRCGTHASSTASTWPCS